MKYTDRILAALVGTAAVAGLSVGIAHAGTVPVTSPDEPSVAMTITNHTDRVEYLVGSSTSGSWVNAPQQFLGPGASEVATATGPGSAYLTGTARYRLGVDGPVATYAIEDTPGHTDTTLTGVAGPQFWVVSSINSSYPTVNVGYDQW